MLIRATDGTLGYELAFAASQFTIILFFIIVNKAECVTGKKKKKV